MGMDHGTADDDAHRLESIFNNQNPFKKWKKNGASKST